MSPVDDRRRPAPVLPLDVRTGDPVSFTSLLTAFDMAPQWDTASGHAVPGLSGSGHQSGLEAPDGTTVLALTYTDGVVMAGDRRATAGNIIAHRRVQKVFPADEYSAVAIAGTAGMAIELIRLFQTELEHYEKIEGTRLSLEGKANYLARMVRNHLPLAFQGLAVVPLFCGFDEDEQRGRLFSFDMVGGRYEEREFATTGSGGAEARSFLKGAYTPEIDEETAIRMAVEALVAAAEEDAATGGPDVKRGIYPNLITVTTDGLTEVEDERLAPLATEILEGRR